MDLIHDTPEAGFGFGATGELVNLNYSCPFERLGVSVRPALLGFLVHETSRLARSAALRSYRIPLATAKCYIFIVCVQSELQMRGTRRAKRYLI
jgi:hypothetical protein